MSRYGDNSKKEFIKEQLDTISWEIYDKDWYDLSLEEQVELTNVILSIIVDNNIGYEHNFKEPMFKEE